MNNVKYALRNNKGKFIHREWVSDIEEEVFSTCDLNDKTSGGILYNRESVAKMELSRLPAYIPYYTNEPSSNFSGVEVVKIIVQTVYGVVQ